MSPKELRKILLDDPETTFIEFGGEKRPFLFSFLGGKRAHANGVEVLPVLLDVGMRLASLWTSDNGSKDALTIDLSTVSGRAKIRKLIVAEDFQNLAILVYWGLVTFDKDLTLDEVMARLTPGRLIKILPTVIEKAVSYHQDTLEEDVEVGSNGEEEEEEEKN